MGPQQTWGTSPSQDSPRRPGLCYEEGACREDIKLLTLVGNTTGYTSSRAPGLGSFVGGPDEGGRQCLRAQTRH